jgi:hypothetical protein
MKTLLALAFIFTCHSAAAVDVRVVTKDGIKTRTIKEKAFSILDQYALHHGDINFLDSRPGDIGYLRPEVFMVVDIFGDKVIAITSEYEFVGVGGQRTVGTVLCFDLPEIADQLADDDLIAIEAPVVFKEMFEYEARSGKKRVRALRLANEVEDAKWMEQQKQKAVEAATAAAEKKVHTEVRNAPLFADREYRTFTAKASKKDVKAKFIDYKARNVTLQIWQGR